MRWQRRLYTAEGERWVDEAWRRLAAMYGYALVAMLFVAVGGGF